MTYCECGHDYNKHASSDGTAYSMKCKECNCMNYQYDNESF